MHLHSLRFKDPALEARYLEARDKWLRERAHRIVFLIAVLFAGFAAVDYLLAPDQYLALLKIRFVLISALAVAWALYQFVFERGPVNVLLTFVTVVAYAGILAIRFVVGTHSHYEFSQAIMLAQTGVWLIMGFTFVDALRVNFAGFLLFEIMEVWIIKYEWIRIVHDSVYIIAASLLAGFAAHTIERFIRREYVAREELRKRERETRMQALRDDLTGLWDRAAMDERVQAALQRAGNAGASGAVIMVDLDKFKPVNDQYGHSAGDEVLISIARRIQSVVRPGDSVGRMGGDEFMVLVEDLSDPEYPDDLTERLRKVIESPTRVRIYGESMTVEVQVGASIGVARFPDEAQQAGKLIDLADRRMYRDKADRKGDSPVPR